MQTQALSLNVKQKNNKTTGIKTKQKWKEYDTVTKCKISSVLER